MRKKLVSVVVSAALAVGLCPASALADSGIQPANSGVQHSRLILSQVGNSVYKVAEASHDGADEALLASLRSSVSRNKQQLEQAEQRLSEAGAVLKDARAAYGSGDPELEAAKAAESEKRAALTEAQQAYDNARDALDAAQAAFDENARGHETAEKDRDAAQAIIDEAIANNQEAISEKQVEIATARTQFSDAQATQQEKDEASSQAAADLASANQAVADAQAAYDAARTAHYSSADFWDDRVAAGEADASDAQQALNALSNAKYASSTNTSAVTDATNADNVLVTFQMMKDCNLIRASLGLGELKVTHLLMAHSQSNVNWSSSNMDHASQWSDDNSENLAWGYGYDPYDMDSSVITSSNPFEGWYDREKRFWDQIKTSDMEAKLAQSTYAFYQAYPSEFMQVGHYLNVIDPKSKATGFAYSTKGRTFGQVFRYSFKSGEQAYTVSDYEAMFTAWLEGKRAATAESATLAAARSVAASARATADAAAAEASAAADVVASIEAHLAELEAELETLQQGGNGENVVAARSKLAQVQSDLESLSAEAVTLQSALGQATAEEAEKGTVLAAARQDYDIAAAALEEAKRNSPLADIAEMLSAAETEYDAAMKAVEQARASLADAQAKLAAAESESATKEGSRTDSGSNNADKPANTVKAKAANTMKVKSSLKTVKYKKVKKKAQTVKPLAVKKGKGKVTYSKVAKGSSKWLKVSKTTGKVTVKKGAKKGLHKATVVVRAAGTANFEPLAKTVTVRIRVA